MDLLKAGGTVELGGDYDESSRYISPTLITDVSPEDEIMKVDKSVLEYYFTPPNNG